MSTHKVCFRRGIKKKYRYFSADECAFFSGAMLIQGWGGGGGGGGAAFKCASYSLVFCPGSWIPAPVCARH